MPCHRRRIAEEHSRIPFPRNIPEEQFANVPRGGQRTTKVSKRNTKKVATQEEEARKKKKERKIAKEKWRH